MTYTSGTTAAVNDLFEGALSALREDGAPPLGNVVGGHALDEGPIFQRNDPSRASHVASRAHAATPQLLEDAMEAARAGASAWRAVGHEERCDRLIRVSDAIAARQVEIAATISLETGKTRQEALAEAQEGVDLFRVYAESVRENDGFVRRQGALDSSESNTSVLKPYGVFAVISPFNFPFALAINMASAALFAGNAVILKPSEEAPRSAALIAELVDAAELPPGAFNVLHGGPEVGRALVASTVDGVAFTGSAAVGLEIARAMTAGQYVRPALAEMGGKNPTIVAASADLDSAVEGVGRAAYGLSGQKCSACSRAIVDGAVYDEFVERLAAWADNLAVGDALDPETFLGPVINARAVERFEACVAAARAAGTLAAGGERAGAEGHFVRPTVVAGLPRGHDLTREELFVPFVTVTQADGLDDALAEANATRYGLTAGIFARDDAEITAFLERIQAGTVYVNHRTGATTGAWPGAQSLSGWKSSGTSGKGGLGPHYVAQFAREQSQTIVL